MRYFNQAERDRRTAVELNRIGQYIHFLGEYKNRIKRAEEYDSELAKEIRGKMHELNEDSQICSLNTEDKNRLWAYVKNLKSPLDDKSKKSKHKKEFIEFCIDWIMDRLIFATKRLMAETDYGTKKEIEEKEKSMQRLLSEYHDLLDKYRNKPYSFEPESNLRTIGGMEPETETRYIYNKDVFKEVMEILERIVRDMNLPLYPDQRLYLSERMDIIRNSVAQRVKSNPTILPTDKAYFKNTFDYAIGYIDQHIRGLAK